MILNRYSQKKYFICQWKTKHNDNVGGVRTSMTICKNCGKAIKWFRDTEKDKWIPLESNCELEYEKPEDVDMDEVARWRHKCNKTGVLKCNKGCGAEIYFDPNNKSPSGKLIQMEVATHENHTCTARPSYSKIKEPQEEFGEDMNYSL